MAATVLGASGITLSDGTNLLSSNLPYTNITNPNTKLSQFTNDLGNYGTFLTNANVTTGYTVSTGAYAYLWLATSGNTLYLTSNGNCNCNCNCNC